MSLSLVLAKIQRVEIYRDSCSMGDCLEVFILSNKKGVYYIRGDKDIKYKKRGFMYTRMSGEHGFVVTDILYDANDDDVEVSDAVMRKIDSMVWVDGEQP